MREYNDVEPCYSWGYATPSDCVALSTKRRPLEVGRHLGLLGLEDCLEQDEPIHQFYYAGRDYLRTDDSTLYRAVLRIVSG